LVEKSILKMSISEYIEETGTTEVRELLMAAHHFLLEEILPPFATCAGIMENSLLHFAPELLLFESPR
jgi:hypothetical protein